MAKKCVGIDIGTSELKLAVCNGGVLQRVVSGSMPENLSKNERIVSPVAMAQFLKQTAAEGKVSGRTCALILPTSVAFTRTMTIPIMSREHLKLNLPYEFRDFITQEKDKYFYDYAVLGTICDENGTPQELELIAAATLKETIAMYSEMCRRAGFKLVTAIPEEVGYMSLIRSLEQRNGAAPDHEYCFIDLGHTATHLHFFEGAKHRATRVVDLGAQRIDAAIAELQSIDEVMARAQKHANTNDVLNSEACLNVYGMISIEVMRAINFYRFNNRGSTLDEVLLCGGGAKIAPLCERLAADIGMKVRFVDELVPEAAGAGSCPAAIGAAIQ